MPGQSPLPPPGLSSFPQEGLLYNPEEQPPVPSKNDLTTPQPIARYSSEQNSPSTPSYDDKTPFDQDEEGDVPLLSLSTPQSVTPPLTRDMGDEGIVRIDVPHSTGTEQRKNFNRLPDYRWTHISLDDTAYGSRSYPAEAQCTIEMPSPSSRYFDAPPTSASTSGRFPKPPKQHPFAKNFEEPQWRKLAIHTTLCALAYPFLLIFVILGQGKDLVWSRLFVGAGCSILGVTLGLNLLRLARGILEAATWATVIHQSHITDEHGSGIRLKDLAAHSDDPTSSWAALRLLWDRHSYRGAGRENHKFYDSRNWSIWVVFFLLNVVLSGTLSFLLARVVVIDAQIVDQRGKYYEVVVTGDLSDDDRKRADAVQPDFDHDMASWTLAPSSHNKFPDVVELNWKNDTVFFSEVILSMLVPGGSGFGTFDFTPTAPSLDVSSMDLMAAAHKVGVEPASVLRFPRWGIRIKCAKIPELPLNLVPLSENNFTYLFTPQDTIRPLFDSFGLDFPEVLQAPVNFSTIVDPNDTLPSGLNQTGTSMGAKFWNNGIAYSMKSTPLSMGRDGKGFMTMEHILIRLNTTFTPQGTFATLSNDSLPDRKGFATFIGYDAAVCLQLFEPWIVEVYNSSFSFPTSMRIVDNATEIRDLNTPQVKEKIIGKPVSNPLVKRALNSSNLWSAYIVGHQNCVNQMLKDSNGLGYDFGPSPMLISFTNGSGQGFYGYTELSEVYYARARALAEAGNVLPYFTGSGLTIARRYQGQVVTSAAISNPLMASTMLTVFLMGLISALFVPRLPLDMPRRGFDLYSWFSAFYMHELVAECPGGISRNMELRDIIDRTAKLKFQHYVA